MNAKDQDWVIASHAADVAVIREVLVTLLVAEAQRADSGEALLRDAALRIKGKIEGLQKHSANENVTKMHEFAIQRVDSLFRMALESLKG